MYGTMHAICRFDFFVHNEYHGSCEMDGAEVGIYLRWKSIAYFCGKCGEVWGRIVLAREGEGEPYFWPVPRACEKHFEQWDLAGSLLGSDLTALIPLLPAPLAAREAILHLNDYTGD